VLDHPRRCGAWWGHPPDRVEQANAFGGHELAYLREELVIMGSANVLEHANRDDAIIPAVLFAIVEQLERYLLAEARGSHPIHGNAPLLLRKGQADNLDIPCLSEVQGQSAKTGSDVEDTHAGLEQQLLCNPLLLVGLRVLQTLVFARKVGARI